MLNMSPLERAFWVIRATHMGASCYSTFWFIWRCESLAKTELNNTSPVAPLCPFPWLVNVGGPRASTWANSEGSPSDTMTAISDFSILDNVNFEPWIFEVTTLPFFTQHLKWKWIYARRIRFHIFSQKHALDRSYYRLRVCLWKNRPLQLIMKIPASRIANYMSLTTLHSEIAPKIRKSSTSVW